MTETKRYELIAATMLEIKDRMTEVRFRLTRMHSDIDDVMKKVRLMEAGFEKEFREANEETVWLKRSVQTLLVHLGQSAEDSPQ